MNTAGRASLVFVTLFVVATPLWAVGGWYLLTPPISEYNEGATYLSGYTILVNKPLSQWVQQGAFDSASDCEAVKDSRTRVEQDIFYKSHDAYRESLGRTDQVVLKAQRLLTEGHNAKYSALWDSRCIRSDDPRLRQ